MQGRARTQSPWLKKYALETLAGINPNGVHVLGVTLGGPSWWSGCLQCQVSMTRMIQLFVIATFSTVSNVQVRSAWITKKEILLIFKYKNYLVSFHNKRIVSSWKHSSLLYELCGIVCFLVLLKSTVNIQREPTTFREFYRLCYCQVIVQWNCSRCDPG